MNSDKLKKLESISQKIISEFFIEELRELDIDFWLINIAWVKISSDLSYLDISISSFKNQDILTKTIAKYAPEMNRKLHKKLSIRKMPKIRLKYDESWEISQDILKTINNL